jgi:hypothetical protein
MYTYLAKEGKSLLDEVVGSSAVLPDIATDMIQSAGGFRQ